MRLSASSSALALALAACVPAPPSPARVVESPLGAVAPVRAIAFRALADGRPVAAVCEIAGPGYRVEITTPAAVEIPLTPDGRPDATALACRRGSAVARADAIAAEATDVTAVFGRDGSAGFVR
jgi:hypothetical protein